MKMNLEEKVERLAEYLGIKEWDIVDNGYVPEKGERIVKVLRYIQLGWKDINDVYDFIYPRIIGLRFNKIVYRKSTRRGHSRLFLIQKGVMSMVTCPKCGGFMTSSHDVPGWECVECGYFQANEEVW